MHSTQAIGIFDSGYGGLTIMDEILKELPAYDYVYLGDNARAPYGTRSFETVYRYTLECVRWFFQMGCPLVILACNTASAKALRTIQQVDLPEMGGNKKVLGVIRPTTEIIGKYTKNKCVGILATNGTVQSNSYPIEIHKFFPEIEVIQEACPMWVPLVENNEHNGAGADYFVQHNIEGLFKKGGKVDAVLLACTHYPMLQKKIENFLPQGVTLLSQGRIVAESLASYLVRHPEIETKCSKNGGRDFYTTDSTLDFNSHAGIFFGQPLQSKHVDLIS